jgi:hypothetical protein
MDLASAPRRTARKKGSGYENARETASDKLVPSLQFVPDSSTVWTTWKRYLKLYLYTLTPSTEADFHEGRVQR